MVETSILKRIFVNCILEAYLAFFFFLMRKGGNKDTENLADLSKALYL